MVLASLTPRPFTVTDYEQITETSDQRFELIDGELIVMTGPTVVHQRLLRRYYDLLNRYLQHLDTGEVLSAPLDVELSTTDIVQPDILFVGNERASIIQPQRIVGAPDLILEISSPSTQVRDLVRKKRIYEAAGVREYWFADLFAMTHTTWALEDSRYVDVLLDDDGLIRSRMFPDLMIDPAKLFAGLD